MNLKSKLWPGTPQECAICRKSLSYEAAQVDHIIPVVSGGKSIPSNVRWTCTSCNARLGMKKAADVLATVSNSSGILARAWIQLFDLAPRLTVAISIILSIAAATLVYTAPKPSVPQQAFAQQIAALDQTQRSLDQLSDFVAQQRKAIATDQSAIVRLRAEQNRLRPLIQADRKTVDALLAEQQVRADATASRERWYGAGLGILGAFFVSAVLKIGSIVLKRLSRGKSGSK